MAKAFSALVLSGAIAWLPVMASGQAVEAAQALPPQLGTVLHKHGLTPASPFAEVGDYWQGLARRRGRPVQVYVFDNGKLWIEMWPEISLKAVEGPNGAFDVVS